MDNPVFEYGIEHLKDKVIRKVHGLTEEDKLNNLVNCFPNAKGHMSKITSIAHAISHHYQSQIINLSPKEAEMWGRYAFLHLADLFMSGVISGPLQRSLTAEELGEEAVLWLSYVSSRHHPPRIKLKVDKKLSLQDHFMQPMIQFKDCNDKIYTCSIMLKDKKDLITTQNDKYPPRWATQRELIALTKLWNDPHTNRHQTLPSEATKSYRLIFDQKAVSELTEKNLPFKTMKSPYKSKSKRLKEQDNELKEMKKKIHQLEKPMTPIRAVKCIQFWYRCTHAENQALALVKNKENSLLTKNIMRRRGIVI